MTVKELKIELEKFKDDDTCYAYEGEVMGIIIERENTEGEGVIYCAFDNRHNKKTETIK